MRDIFSFLYFVILYITYPLGIFFVALAELRIPTLIQYGKTLSTFKKEGLNSNSRWIKFLFGLQVKRSLFIHFYILSSFFSGLNSYLEYKYRSESEVRITISNLFLIHSVRRLIETYLQNKKNKKTTYMNISHYLVGIWLYANVNYLQFYQKVLPLMTKPKTRTKTATSSTEYLLVGLFLVLQYLQTLHHAHLRALVKYTVPYKYLFKKVFSAHYFIEILIYLNLVILDDFSIITVFPFVWTVINLTVSAQNTQKWYLRRFKIKNSENSKKSIIPYAI